MDMHSGINWPSMPWVGGGIIGVVNVHPLEVEDLTTPQRVDLAAARSQSPSLGVRN
jgi:hypothetical protein